MMKKFIMCIFMIAISGCATSIEKPYNAKECGVHPASTWCPLGTTSHCYGSELVCTCDCVKDQPVELPADPFKPKK